MTSYHDALMFSYSLALFRQDKSAATALEKVFELAEGRVPSAAEVRAFELWLVHLMAAAEEGEPTSEVPAAFADFIEQELDLSDFDQPTPTRYRAGDKVLYWHTASKTWLEGEINWVYQHGGVGEYRYSVRVRFPNGKHRAVGRVTLAKLKPQE